MVAISQHSEVAIVIGHYVWLSLRDQNEARAGRIRLAAKVTST
jgi:hypothetical protein